MTAYAPAQHADQAAAADLRATVAAFLAANAADPWLDVAALRAALQAAEAASAARAAALDTLLGELADAQRPTWTDAQFRPWYDDDDPEEHAA
jgi:hypothetical protein